MKKTSADSRRTQNDFQRQLGAGTIGPLYLFEGDETLLRDNALKDLIAKVVDPDLRDFNVTSISAVNGDITAPLEIAGQLPMMSPRRVVIVTGFETISDERQVQGLERYLNDPNPSSDLVFVSNALDNRRAISGLLRRSCTQVSFNRFEDGQDAPEWIARYFSNKGVRIGSADAAFLVGLVGTDLRRLTNEADKLTAYVGESGRIARNDIEELVPHSRDHTNFEIADAIRDGNRGKALRLLSQMFSENGDRGEAPALLGALAASFRRLLIAKEMIEEGLGPEEIAKAIGSSVHWARPVNERARKVDRGFLLRSLERIAETDVAVKSSLGTPRLQLEFLICELCTNAVEK